MIKIFNENERNFDSNGNKAFEPIKCNETRKKSLTGWYIECEVDVKYREYILKDKLCVIKSKSKIRPQAFRIDNPKIEDNKIIFIANHVMFDAENYHLLDVRPENRDGLDAIIYINDRTDTQSPFSVYSNVDTISTAYFIRKSLLEAWAILEERWRRSFRCR